MVKFPWRAAGVFNFETLGDFVAAALKPQNFGDSNTCRRLPIQWHIEILCVLRQGVGMAVDMKFRVMIRAFALAFEAALGDEIPGGALVKQSE